MRISIVVPVVLVAWLSGCVSSEVEGPELSPLMIDLPGGDYGAEYEPEAEEAFPITVRVRNDGAAADNVGVEVWASSMEQGIDHRRLFASVRADFPAGATRDVELCGSIDGVGMYSLRVYLRGEPTDVGTSITVHPEGYWEERTKPQPGSSEGETRLRAHC